MINSVNVTDLFGIYLVIACPLFFTYTLEGFPTYFAQVVFWPIAIIVEIILSTIRWIKSIKV